MVRVYPVIFTKTKKSILVEIPDFNGLTEGKDMKDAIFMAKDYIGLMGSEYILEKKKIPAPSTLDSVNENKGEFSKEGKNYKMLVDVDIENYAERYNNKTVRRNVSIPKWLDTKVKELNINVSKLLTEALTKKIACL